MIPDFRTKDPLSGRVASLMMVWLSGSEAAHTRLRRGERLSRVIGDASVGSGCDNRPNSRNHDNQRDDEFQDVVARTQDADRLHEMIGCAR